MLSAQRLPQHACSSSDWVLSDAAGELSCIVRPFGAELCSLRRADGQELLWHAGAEWPRHSPILFPIVGRLRDDRMLDRGKTYELSQHGFARDRVFEWIRRDSSTVLLRLEDDPQTRAMFPYRFKLDVSYAVRGNRLTVRYVVSNTGTVLLPVSLGAHPAFRWPIQANMARSNHRLLFGRSEPEPIRRVVDGLLAPDRVPSPIRGRSLTLDDGLFENDAVILDRPASRSLRYGIAGQAELRFSWYGFQQLGIWSKLGAGFICLEPWHGYVSPLDFEGEFVTKPGLMLIPPGGQRHLGWRVSTS